MQIDRKGIIIYRPALGGLYSIENTEVDEVFYVDHGEIYEYEIKKNGSTFLFVFEGNVFNEYLIISPTEKRLIEYRKDGISLKRSISIYLLKILFISDSDTASSLIKPIQVFLQSLPKEE
jgi:hypothetical protein